MNTKKWLITLTSSVLTIVIIFGSLTYLLDPLLQYGSDRGILKYREYSEIYCNPGIAKNYNYNAVFLGSSMVENANVAEIDDYFNCTTIKVPYSGGTSYNHKKILETCYCSDNDIKTVFWSLDEYAFTTDKNTPRYPLPEYLYDNNKFNDISYLLNLDIFYFYTFKDILATLQKKEEILMKDGSWCEDESIYNKKNALSSVSYPLPASDTLGADYYNQNLYENLEHNILPFVKDHPETNFYFYMVPYSISYWYMSMQSGKLDAELNIASTVIGELLKFDNVKIFFFQNEYQIITDLNNYKDYSHFKPSINSYMSKQMSQGKNELTNKNYQECIYSFHEYLTSFDYDSFYREQLNTP